MICLPQEAVKKFGAESLKIYTSSFVNLWYGPYYEVRLP